MKKEGKLRVGWWGFGWWQPVERGPHRRCDCCERAEAGDNFGYDHPTHPPYFGASSAERARVVGVLCAVVVVSKTFTTAETMLNARTIRTWITASLG